MNLLASNDRRAPHWHDQAQANRNHFHPEDAERERVQMIAQLDRWLAELRNEELEKFA